MSNEHVAGLHIVRATPVEVDDPRKAPAFLFVAALPMDQAAAGVQKMLPADWKAELTDQVVTKEMAARIKLRPGQICEWDEHNTVPKGPVLLQRKAP